MATETDTIGSLIEKLEIMIPELLDANHDTGDEDVPFELLTRQFQTVRRRDA